MRWGIKILSYWSPDLFRTRSKICLKNSIYIGDEESAGFKIEGISAYVLDFKGSEILDVVKNKRYALPAQSLFELKSGAIRWREFPSSEIRGFNKKAIISFLAAFFVVGALGVYASLSSDSIHCDRYQDHLAKGDWNPRFFKAEEQGKMKELMELRQSFQSSLKENLVLARYQLEEIRKRLQKVKNYRECGVENYVGNLESQFVQSLAPRLLVSHQELELAKLLRGLNEKYGGMYSGTILDQLRAFAKDLAWESWRLQSSDPARAFELKSKLKELCRLITENSSDTCFNQ